MPMFMFPPVVATLTVPADCKNVPSPEMFVAVAPDPQFVRENKRATVQLDRSGPTAHADFIGRAGGEVCIVLLHDGSNTWTAGHGAPDVDAVAYAKRPAIEL